MQVTSSTPGFVGEGFRLADIRSQATTISGGLASQVGNPYAAEAAQAVQDRVDVFMAGVAPYEYPTEEGNPPTLRMLVNRTDRAAESSLKSTLVAGGIGLGLVAAGAAALVWGPAVLSTPVAVTLGTVALTGAFGSGLAATSFYASSVEAKAVGAELQMWGQALQNAQDGGQPAPPPAPPAPEPPAPEPPPTEPPAQQAA